MDRIESTIFRNLIYSTDFVRKAFPFLKAEYFQDSVDRAVFDHISRFVTQYNTSPTVEAIVISLQNDHSLPEDVYTNAVTSVYELQQPQAIQYDWLIDHTEKFCKEKALYNAIMKSITIIDGKDPDMKPDALPSLLSSALAVCFDTNIGHDFFDNAADRYDFYHREEEKIPFDLDWFNKITDGGLPRKTLNVILSGPNAGKSLVMCHMAAGFLATGKNVLYISMEMSEAVTALRIDANLLDMDISRVKQLDKDTFLGRLRKVQSKTCGKLVVKEYPTSGAHAGHFTALLNELKLKKNFVPDVIFVDYLNICLSSRVKGANANSYTIVKSISEELRGLAVEFNVPVVSATQTVRSGVGSSDLSMTDVSESIGIAATVDMLIGLIRTPELDEQNQLLFKLLKSRYVDAASFSSNLIGVERSKMKLYELESSAQDAIFKPPSSGRPPVMPTDNGDSMPFAGSRFKGKGAIGADFKM